MTRLSSKVLASAGSPCGVRHHRLEYGPMPKDGLSLEDKVGQLFWIGFRGTALEPPLRSLLERVRPGGLILFARNIESAPQVRSLNDALNGFLRIPPFIALDQEGGRVNRLRPILGPIPPNLALARRRAAARAVGQQAGAMVGALRSLGFSVNLAPVLDLSGPDPANGIGDRAFGEDPATVCRLARVFLETHLRAGVVPVGKHFPGLGAVLTGEVDERRVDRSLKRINALKARFLRPRRRARFSEKALERSRRALAALGAGQDSGSDPTARL